jgi:hypothetical protein
MIAALCAAIQGFQAIEDARRSIPSAKSTGRSHFIRSA